jgi:two-component sensor histidine kinase
MTGMISMKDNTYRILTIEDERIVRENIAAYLEDSGFLVTQAENGRVGLEAFHRDRPDLVLVDLRMPEVNGLKVLAEVTGSSPETPIIVVSGTGLLQDAVDALKSGAWDYVIKPIQDLQVLEHSVRRALERANLIRENRKYREHLEEEVEKRTSELRATLEEKELLLQEVHHRVRNNMQIIASLLKLQSGYIKDGDDMEMFRETLNRIKSMAIVHDMFYRSQDFANIRLDSYIRGIENILFRSYGVDPDRIRLITEIADVSLGIDTAIPCGLIINELLSNSLKHAFPEGEKGEIRVTLNEMDDGKYELLVSDDGTGIKGGFDIAESETLGLQLVNSLVGQLRAEVDMNTIRGVEVRVRFGELKYRNRI